MNAQPFPRHVAEYCCFALILSCGECLSNDHDGSDSAGVIFSEIRGLMSACKADSLVTDSARNGPREIRGKLSFLNREFSSRRFSACTAFTALRLFQSSQSSWTTSASLMRFQARDIGGIRELFDRRKADYFSFKAWNRYSWYVVGNGLILVESYSIADSVFRAVNTRVLSIISAATAVPADDSLFLVDTIPSIISHCAELGSADSTCRSALPADTVTRDSRGLVLGMMESRSGLALKWAIDTTTSGRLCVALKYHGSAGPGQVVRLLSLYKPEIVIETGAWQDQVRARHNYSMAAVKVLRSVRGGVSFIVLYFPHTSR